MRGALIALLLLPLMACLPKERPEKIAIEYLSVMNLYGFQEAVSYMHPDLLSGLRENIQPSDGETAEESQSREISDEEFVRAIFEDAPFLTVEDQRMEHIGTLKEDAVSHVLLRMAFLRGGDWYEVVEYVPMKKFQGQWRVYEKIKMEKMGERLRSMY
ncbi:MAG: hypothetical protein LAT61_00240 [Alcanivorax sp.]|nr:hypothetical protein [Alcanivorax sp.]